MDKNKILDIAIVVLAIALVSVLTYGYSKKRGNIYRPPNPPVTEKVTEINEIKKVNAVSKVREVTVKSGAWCAEYENLEEFVNAINQRDAEYLAELADSGKIFKVTRDTQALCSDSGIYKGMVFITFTEGRYTNRRCYTFSKHVR